jgi:hypothetical protein
LISNASDQQALVDDSSDRAPEIPQPADSEPAAESEASDADLRGDTVAAVPAETLPVEEPVLLSPPDQAVSLDNANEQQAVGAIDPLGLEQPGGGEVSFAPEPRRWWVGIAMGLGVLALLGQIFWYQFESWGRDPTLRPVYGFICSTLGCELPVLRELAAMRTQKLLVRSHPELADALVVDAVIVNGADFAQPFPELELRFTTIDGDLVAGRRFKPEEYLSGELAGVTLMVPKTPVRLALEITDPGADAVNYFLSFR